MPKAKTNCFAYTDTTKKCSAVKLNGGRRECEVKECAFYKPKERMKREAKRYEKIL